MCTRHAGLANGTFPFYLCSFISKNLALFRVWSLFFLLSLDTVPPIIEPFSFQDGLSEGMRTRTVCGVSQGDSPLTISWLKDGAALPPQLGANFSTLDAYSNLLSFPSLTSYHSGDYTCVATNPAQETRYTAKLQVKGKGSCRTLSFPIPTVALALRNGSSQVLYWLAWTRSHLAYLPAVSIWTAFFLAFN